MVKWANRFFFQGLAGFRIGDPTQWRLNKQLAGGGAMMDIASMRSMVHDI
jgi:hypothetical protein